MDDTLDGSPKHRGRPVPQVHARHLQNKFNATIKEHVRRATRQAIQDKLKQHAEGLQVQGHLLQILN